LIYPAFCGIAQKEQALNWLIKALSSSIGKKVLMAITGLGLCGFLVVHLAGNLLLYKGPEGYNHYAHSLHAQQALLLIGEIGLLLLFVVHIAAAIKTTIENKAARPVEYGMRQSKIGEPTMAAPASAVMYGTGIVVLVFLLLHLADFRFELTHDEVAEMEPFDKAVFILKTPLSALVYLVGSLVLGYHVLHGFQSAFQSLGLNHPKYMPCIKRLSLIFAIIVGFGFASFPVWAMLFK
jgi:succinate dehydrogenase / fumarate reductase, cytochrome b subunit